jgi:regulatory protein
VDPRWPSKTKRNSSRADAPGSAAQPSLRVRALRLLGRREFSRQELDKRLSAYAENPEELAALLDDLSERGWLSDARYADAIVRVRKDRYGKRAIDQKLKQAGVSEEARASALAGIDADHELEAATTLLHRKFCAPPADDKDKARRVRFLQARGYSLNLALRALKKSADSPEDL